MKSKETTRKPLGPARRNLVLKGEASGKKGTSTSVILETELINRARAAAARHGLTMSWLIRELLEREVVRLEKLPPVGAP